MMTVYDPRRALAPRFRGPSSTEIALGVAKAMWAHRGRLSAGARWLWSLLPRSTTAPKNKAARRRMAQSVNPQFGVNTTFGRGSSPVAYNLSSQNPVWQEISTAPKLEGEETGLRLCGRQIVCSITTTATDTQLFATTTGGATVGTNTINISPDSLNGRVALIGRNFVKYAFRHARFVYEPRVATSQAGSFIVAFLEDPAVGSFQTLAYGTAHSIVPSVKSCFREEIALEYNYQGDELFWSELDESAISGRRQTIQGLFVGFPDVTSIGATQMGDVMIEYCVDLYCFASDYGFALFRIRTQEEQEAVQNLLERMREGSDDGSIRRLPPPSVEKTLKMYEIASPRRV